MFPDLRLFLAELRRRGDLVEIDAVVDPALEAAEISELRGNAPA